MQCFSKWASAKRQQGLEVTCVYCRSTWVTVAIAGSGGGRGIGYLDLSQHSEQHRNPQSLNELYGELHGRTSWIWSNARCLASCKVVRHSISPGRQMVASTGA